MVAIMDDETKRKILAEARATLADKDSKGDSSGRPGEHYAQDMRRREQAAQCEEETTREAEQRMLREAQSCSSEAWSHWFISELRRHLPAHLEPSFEGIAEGIGGLYAELRRRIDAQDKLLDQQRDDIRALKIENARLAIKLAELQTDKVLNAMPTASTMRAVN